MEKKLTVVFDDGCPTCTAGKNFAAQLDKKGVLDFVGMNTERGQALVREHNLSMSESAYAIHEDGRRTSKSRMVRDVLDQGGPLGFLFSLPFSIPRVSDALYDILALHRRHVTKSKTD